MSKFPTIPDFNDTPESLGTALRATKLTLEMIAGQRQGDSKGAPDMFVQQSEPSFNIRSTHKVGDLWIDTSSNTLKYWNGTLWKALSLSA
jgi:hypothetical protein